MPTARQIARLYTLAHACGLTHAQVKAQLQQCYGVDSSKQLTARQYEAVTLDYERRIKAGTHAAPAAAPDELDGALPASGMYTNAAQIRESVDGCLVFQRLWVGEPFEASDALALSLVIDDCRLYRSRDRKLSQKQVDWIVEQTNKYPLWAFRRAANTWLEKYRGCNERYFIGVLAGVVKDQARQSCRASEPALSLR